MIQLSVWQTTVLCTLLNQHSIYDTAATFPKAAVFLARIAIKQLHDDCPPKHISEAYARLTAAANQCIRFLNTSDLVVADTQLDRMSDVLQFDEIALRFFTNVGQELTNLDVYLCPITLVQDKRGLVGLNSSIIAIFNNYGVLIIE